MGYSFAQLEALWIQAGGSAALAPQMAAIAIAESAGDPTGVCYDYVGADGKTHCSSTPVAGGTQADVGLWAIANIHLPAGTDPSVLTDPATNARYAVALAGPTGAGIRSAWAAEFEPGSAAAQRYASALAQGGSSVAAAVNAFVVGDTTGSGATTVYGQRLGPQQTVAQQAGSVNTTPASSSSSAGGFFGPIIDAANNIATEVFLGALAVAFLSGGILWLASTDPAARAAMKGAAA